MLTQSWKWLPGLDIFLLLCTIWYKPRNRKYNFLAGIYLTIISFIHKIRCLWYSVTETMTSHFLIDYCLKVSYQRLLWLEANQHLAPVNQGPVDHMLNYADMIGSLQINIHTWLIPNIPLFSLLPNTGPITSRSFLLVRQL